MFVLLVLMLMLMSWVFSLAHASVCAYAYAYAYTLVKTSRKRDNKLPYFFHRIRNNLCTDNGRTITSNLQIAEWDKRGAYCSKMHLGMENLNSYLYLADFHETLIRVSNQNNEERISLIQGKKQNKTK